MFDIDIINKEWNIIIKSPSFFSQKFNYFRFSCRFFSTLLVRVRESSFSRQRLIKKECLVFCASDPSPQEMAFESPTFTNYPLSHTHKYKSNNLSLFFGTYFMILLSFFSDGFYEFWCIHARGLLYIGDQWVVLIRSSTTLVILLRKLTLDALFILQAKDQLTLTFIIILNIILPYIWNNCQNFISWKRVWFQFSITTRVEWKYAE